MKYIDKDLRIKELIRKRTEELIKRRRKQAYRRKKRRKFYETHLGCISCRLIQKFDWKSQIKTTSDLRRLKCPRCGNYGFRLISYNCSV